MEVSPENSPVFGLGDASFRAAGGYEGVRRLVDTFYGIMSSKPDYRTIWAGHPSSNTLSRDKLTRFLCGWMGGPRLYNEKYGPISIPRVHAHLAVSAKERDQWLNCMREALDQQNYPENFKKYLMKQLFIPADLVRRVCETTDQHAPVAPVTPGAVPGPGPMLAGKE